MILLKKIIRNILDFIFSIFFLINSLFIFIKLENRKKIKKSAIIIYHKNGGFGHQFEINDLIRYHYENINVMYLCLFDRSRFNKYMPSIFNNDFINLPICTGLKLKFNENPLKFGEYEGSKFSFIENFIIFLFSALLRKKILSSSLFYKEVYDNFLFKKIYKVVNDPQIGHEYLNCWYLYIVNNKLKKPSLNSILVKQIKNKTGLTNKKICTIYYRAKGKGSYDVTNFMRDGSDPHEYIDLLKYLNLKGYTICVIGEDDNFGNCNLIFDYKKFNLEKDLFQIFAGTECNLFISNAGGAHYFGIYSDISIGIDFFPYGQKVSGYKDILFKKVFDKNSAKYLDSVFCDKEFYWNYNLKDHKLYEIHNNKSSEILEVVKKYVK